MDTMIIKIYNHTNTYMSSFLYARHLTDVLWYGAIRLSVRPSVRPYVRPSVRTYVRPSVRTSVRSVIHNPCGQDIARTIWPRMLKLSMYT